MRVVPDSVLAGVESCHERGSRGTAVRHGRHDGVEADPLSAHTVQVWGFARMTGLCDIPALLIGLENQDIWSGCHLVNIADSGVADHS